MPSSRSPERTERLRRLVEEAAQRPHSEQAGFLEDSCGDDVLLRSQAEAVLALDAKTKVMQTALSAPPDASDSALRWAKMERLFDLIQNEAPEEREAFLDEFCGDDDSLRAELQSLLLYDDEASGYFEDLAEAVIPDAFQQPWLATSISQDADPMLGRQITHYQILEKLGGGGMGVVYKALDTLLERPVALKFLPAHLNTHEATRTRFIHEAKAASALDHANLGYIHEIGESDDGRLFIAMAYYRGETLKKKIEQGPLSIDEALDYAVQIADGLACAHRAGIIHRDIKPANIMVTGPTRTRDTEATTQQVSGSSPGVVKIVDFGLAKVHDVGLTRTGARLGTVSYMSPEQGRGKEVDHRTDIWALGVVLYEMLTGERPFKGDYEAAVLYAALNSSPPSLSSLRPDLPLSLEQVVLKCLQKEVADRYQDVELLRSDLKRIRQGASPIGATSRPRSSKNWVSGRVWQRPFRRPLLAIPLVLGIVLLALWFSWSDVPGQRHLAVLPFTVIGETTDAQAFSAGLLESLTSKLTQMEQYQGSLWVVPAAEVTASMTPSDARAQLGVTLVVSGSVQMQAERVRLTLNLIDTESRRQIASEQIDHRNTEALALQDEAVLMLARMLRVRLKRDEREELTAGSTEKAQANAFYLRGWGYLRNYQTVEEVELAIDLFRKAIDVDANFALAYAGLGEAYWQKFRRTDDVQWVDDAIEHSQYALRLNDRLAPVYITLGIIQSGQGHYEDALASYQQALEIDPFNAEAYRRRAIVYRRQGRLEDAEVAYERAIELKPGYWKGYNSLAVFYYLSGRYAEAIAQYEQALDLAPSNQTLLLNAGAAYWEMEELDKSVQMIEHVLQLNPDDGRAQSNLATAYFYQGRFADAARLYEGDLAQRPQNYGAQGFLADSYYWIPDRDAATTAYRKAITLARQHLRVSDDPQVLGSLASYYARLGIRDSALVYLNQIESGLKPEQADVVQAFGVGEVYETLGEREKALRWMESALRRDYGWIQVQHSPWLQTLRKDPDFQTLWTTLRNDPPPDTTP